jgi:tetratricopeptide (TPR) repeat protein
MRGRHVAASPIPGEIDAAEALLQKASAADPAYPLPYLALAQLYVGADIVELRPTPVLVGKAREAISKALALDNKIAEAHVILASLAARHEYDWAAAERHVRDALELEPNLAAAHFALAHTFYSAGAMAGSGSRASPGNGTRPGLAAGRHQPTVSRTAAGPLRRGHRGISEVRSSLSA